MVKWHGSINIDLQYECLVRVGRLRVWLHMGYIKFSVVVAINHSSILVSWALRLVLRRVKYFSPTFVCFFNFMPQFFLKFFYLILYLKLYKFTIVFSYRTQHLWVFFLIFCFFTTEISLLSIMHWFPNLIPGPYAFIMVCTSVSLLNTIFSIPTTRATNLRPTIPTTWATNMRTAP